MEGEPEAQQALDLIRDVYLVEHAARERAILGTAEHRALRQTESAPLMEKLKAWLESRQGVHPPKSKLGIAIRYALRQWTELTVFLDDPTVPPDNNRSEAALRVVAVLVSLCTSSSSTRNLEGSIVAGIATRASRTLAPAA